MVGTSKYEEKELFFRKELRRRLKVIKKKYSNHIEGGTWGGIIETIEGTSPYIKKGR